MEQKKSVIKNYLYNLTYQMIIIILPLITTPYISRVLQPDGIGKYSYTQSIVTYFILLGSLGVSMYAQREIAYVQFDVEKRSKIFYEVIILRFITILISLIPYYIFFVLKNNPYSELFLIQTINIIAVIFDISWFFQGLEEFKKTVIRNIIVKLIGVILIFLLVKTKEDLSIYVFIYSITALLGNMSLWLYLPKFLCKINIKSLKIFKHLKPIVILFIPQIATQIYTVLDKTMIGKITNLDSEVGFYQQSQVIVKMVLTIVTSLSVVMLPRMALVFAEKNMEKIKEYMNNSFKFIFFLAFPIMFGIIGITPNFVPWFFGNGYEKVSNLIIIMSPIIIMIALSSVIGTQYLLPTKRQKDYTMSVVFGCIINFIINLILINLFASIGAAISTVISETGVTLIQFYFIRKEINIKQTLKLGYKYLLSAIIMFIVVYLIGNITSVSIIGTLLQVLIGIIIYIFCLFIFKDDFIVNFFRKFYKK